MLQKEILHEIDPELTNEDLDGIVEEVDEDGSGTLDFDGTDTDVCFPKKVSIKIYIFAEFQEMMMG